MKPFSHSWKSSSNRRKQRQYQRNAPLHIKRTFLNAALSKELKKKHGKNNMMIHKGDKVKIMRGQFKKQIGMISRILTKKSKAIIEGIERGKKDGTKTFYPIHASNLELIELDLEDPRRKKIFSRGAKK